MAMKKDPLGDFMKEKDAAQGARMKKINPKGRKLDKNGNPVITKEELAKSGMTLREFMNNERGLTARADSPKKAAPTKDITAPMQGPAVKANPAADQKDTNDRVMSDEARKRGAAPRSRGNVERETGDKMREIIEEQATKERMDTSPLGMKKGGKVKGMHRMPDGKMMKDSAHKKQGGKVAKYSRGGGIAVKGFGKGKMC
tara:strand:+ start:83 stop:682 length:600 start_codon:yes stop_codon:yes gene_type:complete